MVNPQVRETTRLTFLGHGEWHLNGCRVFEDDSSICSEDCRELHKHFNNSILDAIKKPKEEVSRNAG